VSDDDASETAAKSLFVAYSAIDEKSSNLLHRVAAVKTDVSAFCQNDDGAFATLSVYCFIHTSIPVFFVICHY